MHWSLRGEKWLNCGVCAGTGVIYFTCVVDGEPLVGFFFWWGFFFPLCAALLLTQTCILQLQKLQDGIFFFFFPSFLGDSSLINP